MFAQLNELQTAKPGIPEEDVAFKAVLGKQARARTGGEVQAVNVRMQA